MRNKLARLTLRLLLATLRGPHRRAHGSALLRGLFARLPITSHAELHQAEQAQPAARRTVASLELSGLPPEQVVRAVVRAAEVQRDRPVLVLAAHVTALNATRDPAFVEAFNANDFAYIDGISFSILSGLTGKRLHKLATTDLAPMVLKALARARGERVRIAVIGGPDATARAAGQRLQAELPVDCVHASDGYAQDWASRLAELRSAKPEVLILGLGMPLEAIWLQQHAAQLPPCVVITCGGWLRLLSAEESRSPRVVQTLQLEWLYRLLTDPRRTAKRYALGALVLLRTALKEWRTTRRPSQG